MIALVPFALIDGPGSGILDELGVIDRDQPFTELYFPDHLALPRAVPEGSPLVFDFSLRNREGAPQSYSWEVLVGPEPARPSGPDALVIAQGELRLADGEAGVVSIDLATTGLVGPAVVSVVLAGREETIHFPVRIEPASTPPASP